jgi:hypothetical protein
MGMVKRIEITSDMILVLQPTGLAVYKQETSLLKGLVKLTPDRYDTGS